jgi:hypothetical protein
MHILDGLGVDGNKDKNSQVAMVSWISAEYGAGSPANNPLGLTNQVGKSKDDPSSTNDPPLQIYSSKEEGVRAAVEGINNHRGIKGALTTNRDYVQTARIITTDPPRWGTSGLVVTIALEIKTAGGYMSPRYIQHAEKTIHDVGHSAWRDVPIIGGGIADAQASVQGVYDAVTGGFGAIGDFVGKVTDPHTWYRAAQILLGAILLFIGFRMLLQVQVDNVVSSVAPIGGKMKGKGKSKGAISSGAAEVTPEVAAA